MKTRILLALAMMLVLLVASSAPVAAKGAVVPFHAALQTYPEVVDFDPITGVITFEIPGEGLATHLGNSTFDSDSWVNSYEPLPAPQLTNMELTAANGDQLRGTMVGTVVPGAGEGTWQITEGTGRFAGVTGTGVYWYVFDGEEWHLYFDGTLTK